MQTAGQKASLAFLGLVVCLAGYDLMRPLPEAAPAAPPTPAPSDTRASDWLEAVEHGDAARALLLAESLAPRETWGPIAPGDRQLFSSEGVAPEFLTAGFSRWDALAWSHALFFARLARTTAGEAGEPFLSLFQAVTERLAPRDPDTREPLWPFRIWQARRGLCDRQAWVLCELAHQLGLEGRIVYLRDPVTLVSPHTVAQVRQGDRVWVADPLSRVFLADVSAAQLAAEPERARAMWPGRPEWRAAVRASQLWLPAYPQDYCPRNQALQARLRRALGPLCPRFGQDPHARLSLSEGLPCALWFYPIRLLAAEMKAGGA
jgi:hypothetical protein